MMWRPSTLFKVEFATWLLISAVVVTFALPASLWFRPISLEVLDTAAGSDFEVRFVGGPLQDFSGSYQVTIRDATNLNTVDTHVSGVRPYVRGATRPTPITISWWGSGIDYENLPAGEYVLDTCWIVYQPWGFLMNKSVCIQSNVFRLYETPSLIHQGEL